MLMAAGLPLYQAPERSWFLDRRRSEDVEKLRQYRGATGSESRRSAWMRSAIFYLRESVFGQDADFRHENLIAGTTPISPTISATSSAGRWPCSRNILPVSSSRWAPIGRRKIASCATSLSKPRNDLDGYIEDLQFHRALESVMVGSRSRQSLYRPDGAVYDDQGSG